LWWSRSLIWALPTAYQVPPPAGKAVVGKACSPTPAIGPTAGPVTLRDTIRVNLSGGVNRQLLAIACGSAGFAESRHRRRHLGDRVR